MVKILECQYLSFIISGIFEKVKNFWLLNKNEKKNVNVFFYSNDYKIGKEVSFVYIYIC